MIIRYVKYTLSLLFGFLTISNSYSQRTYEPKFYIGGHAGVTLSRINFSPSIPQGFIMGKQFGISGRYAEESNFGLIGEVNFMQRGWSESFDDAPLSYKRTLNYINIPILTHIFFGNNKFKGFFNLGPEVSYMISESESSNFDINQPNANSGFPNTHRSEQYKMAVTTKFDYGISAGAGIELIIANKHSVMLDGRFYYGLGNIFPSHKTDYFSASPNMSIIVSLGYMIRVK
ncbi:MAG: PorT family protein [Muribaculaceae bacterium]|nr:PorT family protein [Muribaculaceae bacterium]